MAPIFELIKKNAVPVNVMRSASNGSLPIPADEMLEVLVYLTQNPVFGQDAQMTLAKWDVQSAIEVLSKDTVSPEVLIYYWQAENRRPGLMSMLIENPAIPESLLMELAESASRESVNMLLASPRVRANPAVVEALLENAYLTPVEAAELRGEKSVAASDVQEETLSAEAESPVTLAALQAYEKEHATEIAAEEGKPFELAEEEEELPAPVEAASAEPVSTAETNEPAVPQDAPPIQEATPKLSAQAIAAAMQDMNAGEQKKLTMLQRVSRLNVGERIKLGFIGGREERSILIRDTARLVQSAVLNSPKLTDSEVESFAGSKNLQENVFREIARQRRFLKLYPVVRNLVNNPKCPLDISLTQIKSLMIQDLKSLRQNKNVPETIRKIAAKLYQEKASRGGPKKE
jgi:hypothetical protein